MTSNSTYVLRALDDAGNEFFYTGRAGSGWVSPDVIDAFTYTDLDHARRKATQFNRFTTVHCLRFTAVS